MGQRFIAIIDYVDGEEALINVTNILKISRNGLNIYIRTSVNSIYVEKFDSGKHAIDRYEELKKLLT